MRLYRITSILPKETTELVSWEHDLEGAKQHMRCIIGCLWTKAKLEGLNVPDVVAQMFDHIEPWIHSGNIHEQLRRLRREDPDNPSKLSFEDLCYLATYGDELDRKQATRVMSNRYSCVVGELESMKRAGALGL